MSSVLMNHSMPYSFERGSSTESGASLVAHKAQLLLSLFLSALELQAPATMPAFLWRLRIGMCALTHLAIFLGTKTGSFDVHAQNVESITFF